MKESPKHDSEDYTDVPYLQSAATCNEADGEIVVFALNRSLDSPFGLGCTIKGFEGYRPDGHIVLSGPGLKAMNMVNTPDTVKPVAKLIV